MNIKKISSGIMSIIFILTFFLIFNWFQKSKYSPEVTTVESLYVNENKVSETLSKLVQFKTVSSNDPTNVAPEQFQGLIKFLEDRFPLVHKTLDKQQLGEQALVYTWQGSNSELKPIMFTAHFDVVPEGHDTWERNPFSGFIDKEFIWGRGTLDDKAAISAMLHAITTLLENNFQPQRTIILAFGGDEEVGGKQGAAIIGEYLASKNIELEFLLDEGMPIADGIMKGVEKPIAMIGIAEKGYLNVKLTATTIDGHTSSPPKQTAVGILALAITALELSPMKANISGPIGMLFDTLARDMKPAQGIIVSNRWLFEPLLTMQLSKQNSTNALIRTTMATTMIQGSQQANVLPKSASATINIRILPGDNTEKVLAHIRETISNSSIAIEIIGDAIEPSPISDINTFGYKAISTSVAEVFPEILVAPSLLIASTDTKHYKKFTNNIYRFRPLWVKSDDISRFHGSNERIRIENLNQMTMFYYQLITNSNK